MNHLRLLVASNNPRTSELASVVLAVALATPGKRKRLGRLRRNRPDLLERLGALGFLPTGFNLLAEIDCEDSEVEFAYEGFEEAPRLNSDLAHMDGHDEEIPF